MNIGRALATGVAAGLGAAAEQVAANQQLDNRLRLLAVEDMLKQRADERARSYQLDDRTHEETRAADPEVSRALGIAKGASFQAENEAKNKAILDTVNTPGALDAMSALSDAQNPQQKRNADLQTESNAISARNASIREQQLEDNNAHQTRLENIKEKQADAVIANATIEKLTKLREGYRPDDPIYNVLTQQILANSTASPNVAPSFDTSKFGLNAAQIKKADTRDYSIYNIDAAAAEHDVDKNLMKGILNAESSTTNPTAISSAGAKGHFQFMPDTWGQYGYGGNVNDPVDGARGNANYIKTLSEKYNGNPALVAAAYNAGPGSVDTAIKNLQKDGAEITTESILSQLPRETQKYVPLVLGYKSYFDSKEAPRGSVAATQEREDLKSPYLNQPISEEKKAKPFQSIDDLLSKNEADTLKKAFPANNAESFRRRALALDMVQNNKKLSVDDAIGQAADATLNPDGTYTLAPVGDAEPVRYETSAYKAFLAANAATEAAKRKAAEDNETSIKNDIEAKARIDQQKREADKKASLANFNTRPRNVTTIRPRDGGL